MKTILLLLVGLGDRLHSVLNGKTPLEAAYTPNLDKLCSLGQTGLMIPYKQGVPLGTEVSHFILGSIRMNGSDLMQMILNLTDRAQVYNFRAGSRKLNYIPKTINKFFSI